MVDYRRKRTKIAVRFGHKELNFTLAVGGSDAKHSFGMFGMAQCGFEHCKDDVSP